MQPSDPRFDGRSDHSLQRGGGSRLPARAQASAAMRPAQRGGSGGLDATLAREAGIGSNEPRRAAPARDQRVRRDVLLNLPIASRLAIGFLLAALVASLAAGLAGILRIQSLSTQSDFYQQLLQSNTALNRGNNDLQLMGTAVENAIIAAPKSQADLKTQLDNVQRLSDDYNNILNDYVQNSQFSKHPSQLALLQEAGHASQAKKQTILTASALRTWTGYRSAQDQIVGLIKSGNLDAATSFDRFQVQPTRADASSSLRPLIQLNGNVADSVKQAAQVEQQNQQITTVVAVVIAIFGIAIIGWVISNTLVRPLLRLRRVTQAVEEGNVEARVVVVGRDEIADVSASVNVMLDAIVGLLDVTRRQRDALLNAAERLFSDVRVAGAGDLRVNAPVSDDPIGMLANAFNFTIGRFRRFVLRTQTALDQLDVGIRQDYDRAESFLNAVHRTVQGGAVMSYPDLNPPSQAPSSSNLPARIEQARGIAQRIARDGGGARARSVLDLAEQAYLSAGRLSQLTLSARDAQQSAQTMQNEGFVRAQMEELRTLGSLLTQLGKEAHAIQQGAGVGVAELDTALTKIGEAARTDPSLAWRNAGGEASGAMAASQVRDLVRLSTIFANDVTALARQKAAITQELRAGVAPFRLDTNGEDGMSALYTPGGYDEQQGDAGGYGAYAGPSRPQQRRGYQRGQ